MSITDFLPDGPRRELMMERLAMLREIAERNELLREIANSGVEFDDDRIRYVTVQINRDTWDALEPWRKEGT